MFNLIQPCAKDPGTPYRARPVRTLVMTLLLVLLSCLAMAIQPRRGAEFLGTGNGTMFRVYAPHATKVSVAGEWNSWSATANPLQKGEHSVWFGQIPQADRWMKYKY
ncbi:MAG TPA: hypothetical protein PLB62_15715, partial [Candidatus Sumerlaeota bacterium]|nr:hypothetical protein [Candidatus Sumerlaeota bacterium]